MHQDNIKLTNKKIYVSSYANEYEERHIGSVKKMLEKHGFQIVQSKGQSDLSLDFTVRGGITVTVCIELRKGNTALIDTESSNPGWGTVIARPIAIAGRVDAALEEFEEKLKSIDN